MTKTEKNLTEAFKGESLANRRYIAFAEKAEKEGHAQAARLFRAAAMAEAVHARNHLRAMKGVKSTAENLEEAVEGESYEVQSMYPPMVEDAVSEGKKSAEQSFRYALEVEKIHAGLFRKAYEGLGRNEEVDYFVCQVCGNTVEGLPPEKCPICGAGKDAFRKAH